MDRLPLYYFNIVTAVGQDNCITQSQHHIIWAEIEDAISTLEYTPKKMYHERIFTYNNSLLIIQPKDVPQLLDGIYMMPDGPNKTILRKLASLGASLVPCEEYDLFHTWQKNEATMLQKEKDGQSVSADEIGMQSVHLLTRNKIIGEVIAQTLSKDEAGILFLNHLHNLKGIMSERFLKEVLGLNVIEMNPYVREVNNGN